MCDFPQNWIVFRLSALGDVILTTGVLNHWHAAHGWRFRVLTKEPFAPVFANNPVVDAVIAARDADLRMPRMRAWFSELAREYAGWGLVDLHGTLRSRLLSFLWKGPVLRYEKRAFARRMFLCSKGALCRATLNAETVPQRYALAVDATPPMASELVPAVYLSESERDFAKSFLAKRFGDDVLKKPCSGAGIVAVHPYAAHAHKAWPKEHYKAFLAALEKRGVPCIILGRGEGFFPGDARDLTNGTSLRESAALLAECSVLVSGDSGPMHLASAVNTPVVALFGPTTREWGFYPVGPRDVVLERGMACRPCSLHGKKPCPHNGDCLALIRPEEVMAAVEPFFIRQ
ncbi:glycosyltransferase family 9 protein [Desulfovibrio sp. OttesenSCG-928-O18]|nr:glycosyltransferase family 9 protein [Desulfovibrio sp. OttesenSCG-928-O18]